MATAIAAKLLVNLKYYCELAHMQNVVTDSVLGSTYISVCRQVNLQFIDMHYDIVFELLGQCLYGVLIAIYGAVAYIDLMKC